MGCVIHVGGSSGGWGGMCYPWRWEFRWVGWDVLSMEVGVQVGGVGWGVLSMEVGVQVGGVGCVIHGGGSSGGWGGVGWGGLSI